MFCAQSFESKLFTQKFAYVPRNRNAFMQTANNNTTVESKRKMERILVINNSSTENNGKQVKCESQGRKIDREKSPVQSSALKEYCRHGARMPANPFMVIATFQS